MAKENTFYFTHDYNARSDKKIKKLLANTGYTGYGLFWAIIEDLYNNSNELPLDYESIAYDLKSDEKTIKSIINDFELFVVTENSFGSMSVQRRMDERNEKSNKARESILKRWNKAKQNTDVIPSSIESTTTETTQPEPIEKPKAEPRLQSKEEKIKARLEREKVFGKTLIPYTEQYGPEMIRDFFDKFREPTKSGEKMKWELEKTWSLELRLKNWQRNDDKWNKNNPIKKDTNGNIIKTGLTPEEEANRSMARAAAASN